MSEMMRILIGYDGSVASKVVLDDLTRAGLPKSAEAIIITCANMPLPSYGELATKGQSELIEDAANAQEAGLKQAEEDGKSAAGQLKKIFPLWNVRSEAHAESPAWVLVNKAEEWKADLIVVGAHGHSGWGRFMGSVSQLVLMQAPCSVRVARPAVNSSNRPGLKIMVAVDGSAGAETAVDTVKNREWPSKTEARVLLALHHHLALKLTHLVPPDLRAVHKSVGVERAAVNRMVDAHVAGLHGKGIEAAAYVREGEAKHTLLTEAETWKADCIYMGARGLSPLRRFLLGSVSMAVAARANCSVEIVRKLT